MGDHDIYLLHYNTVTFARRVIFFCIMPKSKLNEHFRWLIVERVLEGLSCRRIARELNISKSSVSRTFLKFMIEKLIKNNFLLLIIFNLPTSGKAGTPVSTRHQILPSAPYILNFAV